MLKMLKIITQSYELLDVYTYNDHFKRSLSRLTEHDDNAPCFHECVIQNIRLITRMGQPWSAVPGYVNARR